MPFEPYEIYKQSLEREILELPKREEEEDKPKDKYILEGETVMKLNSNLPSKPPILEWKQQLSDEEVENI